MGEIPLPKYNTQASLFSDSEMTEMENLFREVGDECLTPEFCQDLAVSFNSSTCRAGQPTIQWEQVQSWFQEKQNEFIANGSCGGGRPKGPSCLPPKSSISGILPSTSLVLKGGRAVELAELAFEAKSAKDKAWYDVASFLSYRKLMTGDIEARVRFVGFRNSDDEWVNLKRGIRERSIPLEASECHKVKVGDLVLCYQERSDYAVYVDAHIREIHRRLHDIKGCRCIFLVHYDDENTEEKVKLNRICCRP